ncbi:MAG: S8 family serine peptidase, partial [Ferruginibacter sp.]|nr:S8 family serine peptidase [Cytophagales bacterium]
MRSIPLLFVLLCGTVALAQHPLPPGFRFAAGTTSQEVVPDQVLVKFRPNGGKEALGTRRPGLDRVAVERMRPVFPGQRMATPSPHARQASPVPASAGLSRIYRLQLKPARPAKGVDALQRLEKTINQLRSDPNVEYAEPVYRYENLAAYLPNDPLSANQPYLETIGAYQAWQIERGSPDVTIGISDYGFSLDHEDLATNLQYNPGDPVNGRDDDHDGYVDNYAGWDLSDGDNDLNGNVHGTCVAGLAAARADNRTGIAGVGFHCRFLPVKMQGSDGFKGFESIVYLADRGCKVINLSWGRRGGPSAYEEEIIRYATVQKDVVLVAAAGNDGNARYFYPASYADVLSVTATDAGDRKWAGANYNDQVDLSAPGVGMFSTTEGSYAEIGSGTSFATPLVAGAAALVRSHYPHLSAAQVRELLTKSSDNVDARNPDYVGKLGAGRLNVYRALTEGTYQILQNNQVALALANDGRIGFGNGLGQRSPGQESFRYRGQDLLAGAGVLFGISTARVSDNVPAVAKGDNANQPASFSPLQALHSVREANKDVALAGVFSDTLGNPARIGLEVDYSPYTWMDGKFLIVEYRVKNVSGNTIDHLQAGIYANWDVQGAANNQADWDAANRLGYVYNRRAGGWYAGVQLLTEQPVHYTGLDNTPRSPVQVFDGFTTAEKYRLLSGGVTHPTTAEGAGDVAHLLAATLENLAEGETRVVAFALLVGDNLADLRATATVARNKFRDLKRSPVPDLANQVVCRDTPFVINPASGVHFRLYNALPPTAPIAEGRRFQLTASDRTATYYVTNVDSLFESHPATVHVQVFHALVDVHQTETGADSAQTVVLTDQTEGATWRRWDLGDGTIFRDSAAVTHTYRTIGEYPIRLTVLNAQGCEDAFTRVIVVNPRLPPAEPGTERLRLFPNPTHGVVRIRVPDGQSPTAVRVCDVRGRDTDVGSWSAVAPREYAVDLSDL